MGAIVMLGKDHISISIAFVTPFLIPILFLNGDVLVGVVLLVSVLIGSLLPDADCGGKATLYYRYPMIDGFIKKVVGKSIIFVFNTLVSKKKIKTEHEVKDEHRGIMHSPVGALLSSLMLMLPVVIFALVFGLFNFMVILAIFFGLIIGQLLHLFEDSCTISGINWLFPFSTKELKGKIYTFSKDPKRRDIRPMLFAGILYLLSAIIFLGYAFDMFIGVSVWIIHGLSLIYELTALYIIYSLAKNKSNIWMVKRQTINKINKHKRRIGKNLNNNY